MEKHTRFRIPFLYSHALGEKGGHVKSLGLHFTYLNQEYFGYANTKSLNFWGFLYVQHSDTKEGKLKGRQGFKFSFAKFLGFQNPIKIKPPKENLF
jgi:hypothetical protein